MSWDVVRDGCAAYLIQPAVGNGGYVSTSTQTDNIVRTERDESTIDNDCRITRDGSAARLCLFSRVCAGSECSFRTASDGRPNIKINEALISLGNRSITPIDSFGLQRGFFPRVYCEKRGER